MAREYGSLEKRFKQLIEEGDKLFQDARGRDQLFQEIAENFYPERADFTLTNSTGTHFASNLDTSYPIMACRDLSNAFGAMLRPPGKDWFSNRLKTDDDVDEEGRKWLEMTTKVQRRAIYDLESNFIRATKEGDHDFAGFGQCVISSEPAVSQTSGPILLHRCWHMRDVVWTENALGKINAVHRKWKPSAREMAGYFKNVSPEVTRCLEKEPFKTFEVRHIVIHTADYEKKFRQPYVSVYIDVDNNCVMEEVGSWNRVYVIPRWETVSGSQYAYSPAAIAALPDARLIQAMTYSLLTAGEFAAEPALIGVQEAIKGAVEAFPGGFTAVDAMYDERLGEVLRPLMKGGEHSIPQNLKLIQDTRMMIADAFYLSKIAMPPVGQGGMSPYEVSQRIDEFIRNALPLFEPMETDYNGALMELDFDILLRKGAFGSVQDIPQSLRGRETEFRFESPLRESIERIKGQRFIEAMNLSIQASQVDPLAPKMINWRTAQRDAQRGIGTPAEWMVEEAELQALEQQMQAAQQAQAMMQTVAGAGQVAEQVGKGGQAVKEMMAPAEQPQAA